MNNGEEACHEADSYTMIAPITIPGPGTKAVRQAPTQRRTTRQASSTDWISGWSLAGAMVSCLSLLLFFCSSAIAQSEQPVNQPPRPVDPPTAPEPAARSIAQPEAPPLPEEQRYGTVSGKVVDQTGVGVAAAQLKLARDNGALLQEAQCDEDGEFTFAHVSPGGLRLTISADGFAVQTVSYTLRPGENYAFPPITLSLATQVTEIVVTPNAPELTQEQFKDLEQQRVLGFVPNMYVSFANDGHRLSTGQKFQLALKATTDPTTVILVGVNAGVDQASDRFSGYGQGAQGYFKRYGASYANVATGLFIGGAVLPSLLKQDPRYFYRGTGTTRSRLWYAVTRTFVCKGDNQKWQPNYSVVLGDVAAGAISNLYIPKSDNRGAALTFENAAIGMGSTTVINILQEFLLHKMTSRRH